MKKYGVLIIAILLMAGALAPYIWTFYEFGISQHSEQWDHFGSYIGGIFSGLAFLGVVYQLHTARLEQEKQDFERTFFMMLEHHNNQINSLMDKKIDNNGQILSIVESLYQELIDYPDGSQDYNIRERAEIGDLRNIYIDVNVYFLNLFRILKFIYENREFNEKNKYSSLLRSYVPKNLLVVLSYHLHNRNKSYDEYIKYINEFSFFEHMDLFVLETIFISKITGFSEEDCYKLIRSAKLDLPEVLNYQMAIFMKLYEGRKDVNLDKIREIMKAKYEGEALNIDESNLGLNNKSIHNILFYSLLTFDKKAFKGNFDYESLMIVYENYLNILKVERMNPFLQGKL